MRKFAYLPLPGKGRFAYLPVPEEGELAPPRTHEDSANGGTRSAPPRTLPEPAPSAGRSADWATVFAHARGEAGQRREEQAAAPPAARAVAPSAARFASWADVFARASEPRQATPPARGTQTPPAPVSAADGHPSAATGPSAAAFDWGPIMARIAAERGGPAPQALAASPQERGDWSAIVKRVADPARTQPFGPGRPRPGADAAVAA
jgi:hypothetical protein